mmetsp:Transcript_13067/g.34683  ORF Transcript_13067/g.34683 Transcript_13067/m.34683 type:complete len:242 (+) Transcript_13067:1621-2346(+)
MKGRGRPRRERARPPKGRLQRRKGNEMPRRCSRVREESAPRGRLLEKKPRHRWSEHPPLKPMRRQRRPLLHKHWPTLWHRPRRQRSASRQPRNGRGMPKRGSGWQRKGRRMPTCERTLLRRERALRRRGSEKRRRRSRVQGESTSRRRLLEKRQGLRWRGRQPLKPLPRQRRPLLLENWPTRRREPRQRNSASNQLGIGRRMPKLASMRQKKERRKPRRERLPLRRERVPRRKGSEKHRRC